MLITPKTEGRGHNIHLSCFCIMAKSKNGGSRAYIRGRLGSDVYSVGKTSQGKKQQVVRSLAESVSNPRTSAQMFNRMVMSTVMQAVSAFKPIIDHSFDGLPTGQPSISEFIRRNYALVKADAVAHPSTGNSFGLNAYQEKGLKRGCYVVSAGEAVYPDTITAAGGSGGLIINIGSTLTYGALKAAWGLSADEYITLIGFKEGPNYNEDGVIIPTFSRLSIKSGLSEDTELTSANALAAFDIEGSDELHVRLNEGSLIIFGSNDTESDLYGKTVSILARKSSGAYIHSDAVLLFTTSNPYTADVALPTYPVGTDMFLNGGEL